MARNNYEIDVKNILISTNLINKFKFIIIEMKMFLLFDTSLIIFSYFNFKLLLFIPVYPSIC